jgi:hypothetical protein
VNIAHVNRTSSGSPSAAKIFAFKLLVAPACSSQSYTFPALPEEARERERAFHRQQKREPEIVRLVLDEPRIVCDSESERLPIGVSSRPVPRRVIREHPTLHELLLPLLLNDRRAINRTVTFILTTVTKDRPVLRNVHDANNGVQSAKKRTSDGTTRTSSNQCAQQCAFPRIPRTDEADFCHKVEPQLALMPTSEFGRGGRRRLKMRDLSIPPLHRT